MLFGNRILGLDMGSLTAQSYSRAAQNNTSVYSPSAFSLGAFTFFQSMLSLTSEHGAPVFCHDKFPTRKLNQYPQYKEARFQKYRDAMEDINLVDPELGKLETPPKAEPSAFQQFRNQLAPLLKLLPSVHAYAFGEEADDVLFTLAVKLSTIPSVKSGVYSRDTDMMQLCAIPNSRLILKKGSFPAKIVQPYDIEKHYGVNANQVALFKAFLGDDGDSIPGMGTIHRKAVIKDIIADRTMVDEVYDAWNNDEIPYQKWHKGWYEIFEAHLGYRLDDKLDDNGNYIQLEERGTGQAFINEKIARLNPNCNVVYEYHLGDYPSFEKVYLATFKTLAHQLPPVQVWNNMVGYATTLINVFEMANLPLTVVEPNLAENLLGI